jgi:hypothetical protein
MAHASSAVMMMLSAVIPTTLPALARDG